MTQCLCAFPTIAHFVIHDALTLSIRTWSEVRHYKLSKSRHPQFAGYSRPQQKTFAHLTPPTWPRPPDPPPSSAARFATVWPFIQLTHDAQLLRCNTCIVGVGTHLLLWWRVLASTSVWTQLPHPFAWEKPNMMRCDFGVRVRWRTRCEPGVTTAGRATPMGTAALPQPDSSRSHWSRELCVLRLSQVEVREYHTVYTSYFPNGCFHRNNPFSRVGHVCTSNDNKSSQI